MSVGALIVSLLPRAHATTQSLLKNSRKTAIYGPSYASTDSGAAKRNAISNAEKASKTKRLTHYLLLYYKLQFI
jgi:hypothetical protein